MTYSAVFVDNFSSALLCSSCYKICSYPLFPSSAVIRQKCLPRRFLRAKPVSRTDFHEILGRFACGATPPGTETEPDGNSEEGKDIFDNGQSKLPTDLPPESNGVRDLEPDSDNESNRSSITGMLQLLDSLEKNGETEGEIHETQSEVQENGENVEVTSGSPLPGVKQLGEPIQIPKATIDILKDQVFGFDTFFVTSHEPYEGGVLFKGNLRGKAENSYEKLIKRMEDRFGDQYKLFLLINPEDDMPVAVVVPRKSLQQDSPAVPEWFAAGAFGLVTIFTLLLRNVPALQSNLLSTFDNLGLLNDGVSGAVVTAFILGVHEVSHILVANSVGLKLGVPYFVPSWQIGSFGAITRIVNIVSNREDLLKFAAAGPLAGFTAGVVLLLLGFIIPPSDGIGIIVDPSVFHESFLAGGIAKLLLGDVLKEGSPISINPLVIWAWAGLLINAINSIPAGELDGGRISFALWGRKASTRITSAVIALLGVASLFNDVAFYWVALIFFLQRGPIAPLSEEITDPKENYVALGVTVLLLGLLVCLPYPFPFSTESMNL
ncbi:probable zinc metalloprotease EGY2, chloroplastic isoform X2 [Aristolochia californica]|uniref:probable zinc metalloprotease EGY2, chloroplastic isoform X2 n=1 Tax=Aristolochia californica TaxID=171875 RepID=UPI0035DD9F53